MKTIKVQKVTRNQYLKHQAEMVLDNLRKINMKNQGGDFIGNGVNFENMSKNKQLLIRVVRQAALLEQRGVLVPDIDRMGEMVGWHVSTNWPKS